MEQLALIDNLPPSVSDKSKAKKALKAIREREHSIVVAPNFRMVKTLEELEGVAQAMRESRICVLDVESRKKIPWTHPNGKVVALNVYTPSTGLAYMIPVRMVHAVRNFDDSEVLEYLGDVIADPEILKIGHNFKYDMHRIRVTFDVEVEGYYFDTLAAAMILNENEDHDLETLCMRYLKARAWKTTHDAPFETWPLKMATHYGCKDAELTYKLYEFQNKHLEARKPLHNLLFNIEMPTLWETYEMEKRGVAWDQEYYDSIMKPTIQEKVEEARAKVYEQTGQINLDAPPQVASALFDMLGLPRIEGNSTAQAVLTELAKEHPIAGDVLNYRQWATIDKMFIRQLPKHVVNGRIHCTFNTIVDTGRMSCKDPNLQQLPKRIGPLIRRGIIPSPGCVFITQDFSQIELRLLAHLSDEQRLIQAFERGDDIHAAVMCTMLGVSMDEYKADPDRTEFVAKRVKAKTVNFGVLYGMGAAKLAWKLGITMDEAREFIKQYFDALPNVKKYINNCHVQAYRDGYVTTILGRKRRLPNARSSDKALAAMAEREAANSRIQGSAADLAKLAMIQISEFIRKESLPLNLLLQIHDELIWEVNAHWLQQNNDVLPILKSMMENAYPLKVPVEVSQEILSRWGDKINLDDYDEEEAA